VLWREFIAPLIALEFASEMEQKNGTQRPYSSQTKPGSFGYMSASCAPYHGIYEINNGKLEVYRLVDGFYQP